MQGFIQYIEGKMLRFHEALSEVKCPEKVSITHVQMLHYDKDVTSTEIREAVARSQYQVAKHILAH